MAKRIWELSLEEFDKVKKLNKNQRQDLFNMYSEDDEAYFNLGEFKNLNQLIEKLSALRENVDSFLSENKLVLAEITLDGDELVVFGSSRISDDNLIALHRKELVKRKKIEDELASEGDAKSKDGALKQIERLKKKFKIKE